MGRGLGLLEGKGTASHTPVYDKAAEFVEPVAGNVTAGGVVVAPYTMGV